MPRSQKSILEVGSNFTPSEVHAAGGTVEWYWKEAGIAVAVSTKPTLGEIVLGNSVSLAVADVAAKFPDDNDLPERL